MSIKKYTTKTFKPLNKKVFLMLKDAIIKGELKPGEKLAEEEIAKKLNLSRTPVREALQRLTTLGFLKLYPNQGIFVSQISLEDLKEVVQIRAILEGFATRITTNLITNQEIKKLENINEKMKLCCINNNTDIDKVNQYCNYDIDFHNIIINIANNKRLADILYNLREITTAFRNMAFKIPGNIEYSIEYHIKIIDAFKKRDSKQSEILAQKHVLNSIRKVFKFDLHE
jgi:DNA-binding GntR family transcriptional regulator